MGKESQWNYMRTQFTVDCFPKLKSSPNCEITLKTMKTFIYMIIFAFTLASLVQGGTVQRRKRDLTCAVGGDSVCDVSCKGRGYKDGKCAWEVAGEYSCNCSEERKGIRCNLGGETVCRMGC